PRETAAASPARRYHWIVRLTHWSAFVLLLGMIASGLQIYRAYPRFGERGGPYLPNPFQDGAFPEWARLGGWLAAGINWHLALAWPFVLVGASYLGYVALSGEWRKLGFPAPGCAPGLRHGPLLPATGAGAPASGEAQRAPEGRGARAAAGGLTPRDLRCIFGSRSASTFEERSRNP
ncbi:MAG: cytochrome b/b6 domain-containing protein, partial [Gemmatimonadota bacterium]